MLPRKNLAEKRLILRERYLLEKEIALFIKNGLSEEANLSFKNYNKESTRQQDKLIKAKLYKQATRDSIRDVQVTIQSKQVNKVNNVDHWREEYNALQKMRHDYSNKHIPRRHDIQKEIDIVQTELQDKINQHDSASLQLKESVLKERKIQVNENKVLAAEKEVELLFDRRKIEDDMLLFKKEQQEERQLAIKKQLEFKSDLDKQIIDKKNYNHQVNILDQEMVLYSHVGWFIFRKRMVTK